MFRWSCGFIVQSHVGDSIMADEEPLEVEENEEEEQEETAPSSWCSMIKKLCKDMLVNLWERIKTHRYVQQYA